MMLHDKPVDDVPGTRMLNGLVISAGSASARSLPCTRPHVWQTFAIAILPAAVRTFDQAIVQANRTVQAVCSMHVLLSSRKGSACQIRRDSWAVDVLPPDEAAFKSGPVPTAASPTTSAVSIRAALRSSAGSRERRDPAACAGGNAPGFVERCRHGPRSRHSRPPGAEPCHTRPPVAPAAGPAASAGRFGAPLRGRPPLRQVPDRELGRRRQRPASDQPRGPADPAGTPGQAPRLGVHGGTRGRWTA